ncbi:MAG: fumarylacetoacetate hydrolase family protein [Solirubrobacterales bacterium]
MRYVRFETKDGPSWGVIDADRIRELDGPGYAGGRETGREFAMASVSLLAPVVPGKIICVGLNYKDHIEEFGRTVIPSEPVLFMKPPSAVIGTGDRIVYPAVSQQVDYEAELVAVIGCTLRHASPKEALAGVFGYACGNDVTARDLQRKDVQWTRGKSFDTFSPVGPWIETEADPTDLGISSFVNGEKRQASSTAKMIFPVGELLAFMSGVMTLEPGDVIFTGTPSGVGPVQPGDEVVIEIDSVGRLVNLVVRE